MFIREKITKKEEKFMSEIAKKIRKGKNPTKNEHLKIIKLLRKIPQPAPKVGVYTPVQWLITVVMSETIYIISNDAYFAIMYFFLVTLINGLFTILIIYNYRKNMSKALDNVEFNMMLDKPLDSPTNTGGPDVSNYNQ